MLWRINSPQGSVGHVHSDVKKPLMYQPFPLERASLKGRNHLLIKAPPHVLLLLGSEAVLFDLIAAASAF